MPAKTDTDQAGLEQAGHRASTNGAPIRLLNHGEHRKPAFDCTLKIFREKKFTLCQKRLAFRKRQGHSLNDKTFFLAQELPLKKGPDVRFAGFQIRVVAFTLAP